MSTLIVNGKNHNTKIIEIGQKYTQKQLDELDSQIKNFASKLLPSVQDKIINDLKLAIEQTNLKCIRIEPIKTPTMPHITIAELKTIEDITEYLKLAINHKKQLDKVLMIKLAILHNLSHLFALAGDLFSANIIRHYLNDNFTWFLDYPKPAELSKYYTFLKIANEW